MKFFSIKNLIMIICLVGVFGFSNLAHAQIPVTDGGAISAIGTANGFLGALQQAAISTQQSTASIQGVTSANKTQKSIEDAITVVAYNLAQQISRQLVSLAINEINGGASGIDHPQRFITDFSQLITSATDKTVTLYTNSLIGNSSNPFAAQVGVNLAANYSNNQTALNGFSLNNYANGNWLNSSTNLANSGIYGWDYYTQAGLAQNNPVGSQMIAQRELANSVASAQNVQNKQISTSGYKPAQTPCSINYNSNAGASAITNDQLQLQEAQRGLQAAIDTGGSAPTAGQQHAIADNQNDVALAQQALSAAQNAQTGANVEYGTNCANQIITNPVGAVDSLAAQAIKMPFDNINTNATNAKWYTLLSNTLIQFAQGLINIGINHLKIDLQNASSRNSNSLNH